MTGGGGRLPDLSLSGLIGQQSQNIALQQMMAQSAYTNSYPYSAPVPVEPTDDPVLLLLDTPDV